MNTVFLRLEGPLQSWGVVSRFVVRDTADIPSKSGVLGLICAAMGVRRDASPARLAEFAALRMGVRVDRPGIKIIEYHTAGAGLGMMSAEGKIKKTATTGEFETHVMRKEYLCDAAFRVALQGEPEAVAAAAAALQDPVWPPFLGRKSCPPSVPVYDSMGDFDDLVSALQSIPWRPRRSEVDSMPCPIFGFVETSVQSGQPVADIPVSFTHRVYGMRWVEKVALDLKVTAITGVPDYEEPERRDGRPATTFPGWSNKSTVDGVPTGRREKRLDHDHHLCVFCKQPARDVHHVSYENVGHETMDDLRSVCRLCHDAVTLLEYAGGFDLERIDPLDPRNRDALLAQRKNVLGDRDRVRRNRTLQAPGKDD